MTPAAAPARRGLARWRQRWLRLLVLGWALLGSLCFAQGWAALWPWPLAPLHARCLGVMQLALALLAWPAWHNSDEALARAPLVATLLHGAAALAAVVLARADVPAPWAWVWLAVMLAMALVSALALAGDPQLQAPAEHPRVAWFGFALAAAAAAVALLAWPTASAALWPWKLPDALAWIYAPPLLAWGAVAALLAHERRRYVCRAVERALLLLAAGVLLSSWWHLRAFDWQRLPSWLWLVSFGAVLGLSLQGLLAAHRRP